MAFRDLSKKSVKEVAKGFIVMQGLEQRVQPRLIPQYQQQPG